MTRGRGGPAPSPIIDMKTVNRLRSMRLTATVALELVGRPSVEDGSLVKHVVRQSDNVALIMEQTDGTSVSTDHYRVIFKPEAIVPNIDRP